MGMHLSVFVGPWTSSTEGSQQTTEKLFVKSVFVGSILQMLLCCVVLCDWRSSRDHPRHVKQQSNSQGTIQTH